MAQVDGLELTGVAWIRNDLRVQGLTDCRQTGHWTRTLMAGGSWLAAGGWQLAAVRVWGRLDVPAIPGLSRVRLHRPHCALHTVHHTPSTSPNSQLTSVTSNHDACSQQAPCYILYALQNRPRWPVGPRSHPIAFRHFLTSIPLCLDGCHRTPDYRLQRCRLINAITTWHLPTESWCLSPDYAFNVVFSPHE